MTPVREIRAQAVLFRGGALLCARHVKAGVDYRVLPGGHVEAGESVWEAVVRELAEEARVDVRAGRLWSVSEFAGPGRRVLDCAFRVTDWDGEPRLGTDPEAREGAASLRDLEWVSRDALAAGPFRPGVLRDRLLEVWDDPDAPAAWLGVERA